MVALEPAMAVVALERSLRYLMTVEYVRAYGDDWLGQVTTLQQREKWAERREDEIRRRPAVTIPPLDGLEYSNTYELIAIAKKNWEPLAAALGKQAKTIPLLEHFERVRNTASHSRDLVVFEREIMSGIAGEIRNKVTLYMTAQDPVGEFYPRIDSVVDSFGTAITLANTVTELAGFAQPYTVLHPGEIVTFRCSGVDPRGRRLEWRLASIRREFYHVIAESGQTVELTWEVEDRDIVESVAAEIFLSAKEAAYHRADGFDHRAFIMYRVRPTHSYEDQASTSTDERGR